MCLLIIYFIPLAGPVIINVYTCITHIFTLENLRSRNQETETVVKHIMLKLLAVKKCLITVTWFIFIP